MSATMRRLVEKEIASALIDEALAAGYDISVFEGEYALKHSINREEILASMFSVDDEHLVMYKDGKKIGWVWFVYGNGGWDVISDYSTSLEPIMGGAVKVSQKYE